MATRPSWTYMTQMRLGQPLKKWFKKLGVKTYEEATEALQRAGFSVGTRADLAPHLPPPADQAPSSSNTSPAPRPSRARRTKEILDQKKQEEPQSAAEEAADAITKSNAVKSPKETKKPKRPRKRKPK